jgi:hypothetical protein|tara:strand:- start:85 stop:1332 length:1248 start_codon:yes stop_codon:yes gene_type:complete
MKSWEREKLNKDKLHKDKVLKSLKKKPNFKKLKKEAEKKFLLRKVIERTFLGGVEQGHFVCGNNEWGYNQHTTNMNYYQIILKEYKVYTGHKGDKFEKRVLDLLIKSKNQTPKTTITRKLPFKQKGRSHTHAIPGKDIEYNNNHDPKNPYSYNYCNKTKIDFFKGISGDEKKIIKLGFDKLFSKSFVYGYIETMITIIFKLGGLDESKFDKPKFKRYWSYPGAKGSGSIPVNDMMYDKRFIRRKRLNIFENIFNISYSEANLIIDEIENSIFNSTLTNFLINKDENYFVDMFNSITQSYSKDENYESTETFFYEITKKKKDEYYTEYNKGNKFERINKIHNSSKRLKAHTSGSGPVVILNYEQFRFYNFRIKNIEPYDEKKLNLNEKDLLIRYAIYLGVQEANYYINQIIFSPEL